LNRIKLIGSDIVPAKMQMFPLLLCGKGLTLWVNLRNDAFHAT
jgi:hypothetical protein